MKKSQTILVFIVSSCLLLAGCAEYVALEIAGAVINNSSNNKSSKTKGKTINDVIIGLNDKQLCMTVRAGDYPRHLAEAKRRGLNCGVKDSRSTKVATAKSSTTVLSVDLSTSQAERLIDSDLCRQALVNGQWDIRPRYKVYVDEAKRRG